MANLNAKYEVPGAVGSEKLKRWLCNPDRTPFEGILSSVGKKTYHGQFVYRI